MISISGQTTFSHGFTWFSLGFIYEKYLLPGFRVLFTLTCHLVCWRCKDILQRTCFNDTKLTWLFVGDLVEPRGNNYCWKRCQSRWTNGSREVTALDSRPSWQNNSWYEKKFSLHTTIVIVTIAHPLRGMSSGWCKK